MDEDLTVDFQFGGNGTDHKGTGWSEPESHGTWMLGQQSILILPRPETRGSYRLELDVSCLTGPGHPSQHLAVGVNGAMLAEFVLLDDAVEHCVLPWSVIGREPGLTLVLSHPDAWRPSELTGGEGDQRELSVLLRSARLSLHEVVSARDLDATALVADLPQRPVPTPSAPVMPPLIAPLLSAPLPVPPTASKSAISTPTPPVSAVRTPLAAPPATSTPAVLASQVSGPTAPAPVQEAQLPWWKKLLG